MANSFGNFNPCFYPRMKPRLVSRATGGYYHSMQEPPFGAFLSQHGKKGIDWDVDFMELAYDPEVCTSLPRYSPDFYMMFGTEKFKTEDGEIEAIITDFIDIKAKTIEFDKHQQRLARYVPDGILENIHFPKKSSRVFYPRCFIVVTATTITLYDREHGSVGQQAQIYKCPNCGKIEILPDYRMKCTTCGAEISSNDKLCDIADAMIQYTRRDAMKTELTDTFRTAFNKRCGQYKINAIDMSNRRLASINQMMRIELLEFPSQYYESDFSYFTQDKRFKSYNNTPKLQTHVGIFTDPEFDEVLINALTKHAADNETPIEAFVFLLPDGMYITERGHGAVRRPAHFHTCDKCGYGYISSDEFHECPYCGYEHNN